MLWFISHSIILFVVDIRNSEGMFAGFTFEIFRILGSMFWDKSIWSELCFQYFDYNRWFYLLFLVSMFNHKPVLAHIDYKNTCKKPVDPSGLSKNITIFLSTLTDGFDTRLVQSCHLGSSEMNACQSRTDFIISCQIGLYNLASHSLIGLLIDPNPSSLYFM